MDKIPIEAVYERDIDLLVLEELWANDDFRREFGSLVGLSSDQNLKFEGAWHSVCLSTLGESDLVVKFSDQDGSIHAVLVENKINAIPQPDQAVRYRKRGEVGIAEGAWHRFTTCILAPEKYLKSTSDASLYDRKISYETLAGLVEGSLMNNPKRASYRKDLFRHAIDQNRRGYSPNHNDRVTLFWQKYWELITSKYPDVRMKRPISKPDNASFIDLYPEGFPNNFYIYHKLQKGFVDLETPVKVSHLQELTAFCEPWLPAGMSIVQTKGSCAISMAAPKVNHDDDFSAQKEKIMVGIDSVQQLVSLGVYLPGIERRFPKEGKK